MSKPLIDIDTKQVGRPDKLYDANEMERLVHDLKELYDYYVGKRW